MRSIINLCMRQYVRGHAQMVIAEIDGSVAAGPYVQQRVGHRFEPWL